MTAMDDDPLARRLLDQVADLVDGFGRATFDVNELADVAGCAPSAVRKALRRPAARGLLTELGEREVEIVLGFPP